MHVFACLPIRRYCYLPPASHFSERSTRGEAGTAVFTGATTGNNSLRGSGRRTTGGAISLGSHGPSPKRAPTFPGVPGSIVGGGQDSANQANGSERVESRAEATASAANGGRDSKVVVHLANANNADNAETGSEATKLSGSGSRGGEGEVTTGPQVAETGLGDGRGIDRIRQGSIEV